MAAAEIGRELGNVRMAWSYLMEGSRLAELQRSIEGLSAFHAIEQSLAEGELMLAAAAARLTAEAPEVGSEAARVAARALGRQAALAYERGRHAEAAEVAGHALALVDEDEEPWNAGRTRITWGLALCRLGRLAQGAEVGRRGLELLGSAQPLERADALAMIGAQRGWLEPAEARELLQEAVALQRATGDGSIVLLRSLPALAAAERDTGNYGEALRLLREALEHCETRGACWLQTICLQDVAEVCRRLGEYAQAEAAARRELEWTEHSYPFASGLAQARLSEILKERGRLKEAWAAAQLAVPSSNAFTSARAKLQLADLCWLRGEPSEAKRYWSEAVETFERLDIGADLASAWDGLGWAAFEEEQYATAQQYFRQAGALADKLDLRAQALSVLAGFAASLTPSHQALAAAELAALVRADIATEAKTRARRLEPLLRELQRLLPPSELDAALQRGEKLDWKEALRALL